MGQDCGTQSEVHGANEWPAMQLGARFLQGAIADASFAVRDGKLITGRNAASCQAVAELVVEALSMGVRLTP